MNDSLDPAIVVARDVIFGQVVGDYFDHPHSIALDEAEELARAALEAAAPLIAAEVLREAASGPIPRLALAGNTRAWLRARADQIEHAPRCPHLKCPGGSLCCCADTIEAKEIP